MALLDGNLITGFLPLDRRFRLKGWDHSQPFCLVAILFRDRVPFRGQQTNSNLSTSLVSTSSCCLTATLRGLQLNSNS